VSSLNDTQTLERRAPSWHLVGSSIPPSSPLVVNLRVVTSSLSSCSRFPFYLRPVTLSFDALIFRHHLSRLLRTHRSLSALRSARQPAHYATAHSTTRPIYHSSADRNLRDNGPTCSLLLSPTMIRSNLSALPTFQQLSGTSYPPSRRSRPHFTALLVLLVEDESNDSRVFGEQ